MTIPVSLENSTILSLIPYPLIIKRINQVLKEEDPHFLNAVLLVCSLRRAVGVPNENEDVSIRREGEILQLIVNKNFVYKIPINLNDAFWYLSQKGPYLSNNLAELCGLICHEVSPILPAIHDASHLLKDIECDITSWKYTIITLLSSDNKHSKALGIHLLETAGAFFEGIFPYREMSLLVEEYLKTLPQDAQEMIQRNLHAVGEGKPVNFKVYHQAIIVLQKFKHTPFYEKACFALNKLHKGRNCQLNLAWYHPKLASNCIENMQPQTLKEIETMLGLSIKYGFFTKAIELLNLFLQNRDEFESDYLIDQLEMRIRTSTNSEELMRKFKECLRQYNLA